MAFKASYNGDTIFKEDINNLQKTLNDFAVIVVSRIKQQMPKQGNYRRYIRPYGIHWSSKPGTPPAIDYGRLHDSISYNYPYSGRTNGKVGSRAEPEDGIGQPKGDLGVRIGTKVYYAEWVENGTRNMEARPYLAPIAAKASTLLKIMDERLVLIFKKRR